jgi:hypothetical protein
MICLEPDLGSGFLLLHWWLLELWSEFMCCGCIHINVHKERVTVEAEYQELYEPLY